MTARKHLLQNVSLTLATILAAANLASPVFAQDAAPQTGRSDAEPRESGNPEEIVVTGRNSVAGGLMKVQTAPEAMSSITSEAIEQKLAAASPLQLISTMPGVNFGSSDAYGLSVRNFLSVRGMDQSQIGFLVENIPGIDLSNYTPYTETWADNENIVDITLTPGNSRLQDPIITASGGEFIVTVREPRDEFGGTVAGSVGSYNGYRAFGAIDTGLIGTSGAKAFLSYSRTSAENYVGPGRNSRDHVDLKAVKEWSPGARSSLFFSYNYYYNARIPSLNLAQATDGIATNLDKYQYASSYVPGVTTNYYKNLASDRTTYIVASNNDFDLSDAVTLHITPYYRRIESAAPGVVNLNPTSVFAGNRRVTAAVAAGDLQSGRIFALTDGGNRQDYAGINTWIEADLSDTNHLMVGYWHENWWIDASTPLRLLNTSGAPGSAAILATTGEAISGSAYKIKTDTNQIFIGDTQSFLNDRLKVSVGFKNLFYKVRGTNFVNGAAPGINVSWSRPMPRILVSYEASPQIQLYGNVTTNARMPNAPGTYATTYNVASGAVVNLGDPSTRPEYTVSSQLGLRYNGAFHLDVNVFQMNVSNHQITSRKDVNGTLTVSPISAGGETIRGISFEVSTKRYRGFSAYLSGQYLHGTFDDNIPVGADFLPTKGKTMVQSPKWSGNLGVRYEGGGFFAEATGKYVDDQYSTFMNDQKMPSYHTVDVTLGYKLPDLGDLRSPSIRLNATNLGNKSYISSIATITTNAVAVRGLNGTTIAGSAPQYYVAADRALMLSLRAGF